MQPPANGPAEPRFRVRVPVFAWIIVGVLLALGGAMVALRWTGTGVPTNPAMLAVVLVVPGVPVAAVLAALAWGRSRRRRREGAAPLQQSRDLLQAVMDALPVGVLVVDRSHRLEMANREARRWIGLGEPAPGALRCHHVLCRGEQACTNGANPCPIDRAFESRAVFAADHPGRSPAGKEAVLHVQAAPIADLYGGGGRVVLVFADVTEQRRREAMLERARADAEEATQAHSEFLANMSREIRDPLTTLLGTADALVGSRADDGGPVGEQLHVIRRCAERLLGMVNDLLDLSRMHAGRLAVESRDVSPADILAAVAAMMKPEATRRGDELSVDHATALPRTILCDEGRLRRVLTELVDGAIRFTENGRVRIVASYLTDWRPGVPAVRVRVIDTGTRIDEDDLPALFEPFARGPVGGPKARRRGGLGLHLARRIAEMLGGELKATAIAGAGAVFTLTVPTGVAEPAEMIQPGPDQVAGPFQAEPACNPEALAGVSVLVVDDLPDHQRLIADLLERAGAGVEVADSAADSVARILVRTFHAVVIDVQLPRADGAAAARALRTAGFDGVMLAVTAAALAGDRKECLEAGCDGYLTKPIDPADLVRTLAALVRRRSGGPASAGPRQGPFEGTVKPLPSAFADDPDLAGVLDTFVTGLPTQIQAMREAIGNGHYEELRRRAHQLKGAGGSYGYPALSEQAGALERLAADRDIEAAQLALSELVDLCRAIEAGHGTA